MDCEGALKINRRYLKSTSERELIEIKCSKLLFAFSPEFFIEELLTLPTLLLRSLVVFVTNKVDKSKFYGFGGGD